MARRFLTAALLAHAAIALDNGLGLTPPMSFSTWNSYECAYNETTIRALVDTLVRFGYRDAGYRYVGVSVPHTRARAHTHTEGEDRSVRRGRWLPTLPPLPDPTHMHTRRACTYAHTI